MGVAAATGTLGCPRGELAICDIGDVPRHASRRLQLDQQIQPRSARPLVHLVDWNRWPRVRLGSQRLRLGEFEIGGLGPLILACSSSGEIQLYRRESIRLVQGMLIAYGRMRALQLSIGLPDTSVVCASG